MTRRQRDERTGKRQNRKIRTKKDDNGGIQEGEKPGKPVVETMRTQEDKRTR